MNLPWHRKPVTHAAALWAAVGFAVVLLIVFFGYSAMLSRIESGTVGTKPLAARPARELPSLFGTVLSAEDGVLRVDSKQPFHTVFVDDVTGVKLLDGSSFPLSGIEPGMKIMATGYDAGDGELLADAVVILSE